jgi:hypothetical protein
MIETREAPSKPRSRLKAVGRVALMLAGVAALLALVVVLGNLVTGTSKREVEAKYSAIKPGMTRTQVRPILLGRGEEIVMMSGTGPVEMMHFDDARYLIAVFYGPSPNDPSPKTNANGTPNDNWVVREKLFVELGRTGSVDRTMTGFGLKPERAVDRTTFFIKPSAP